MKYRLLVFLILGLVFVVLAQENIEQTRRELEKTKEKLRALQEKIAALEKEESGVLKRIEAFAEKINLTKKMIRDLKILQKNKENEIVAVTNQILQTQKQIEARRADLQHVLVSYYKQRKIYPLEIILSHRSIVDVYKKFVYLRIIAEDRKTTIQTLSKLKDDLQLQQKQLEKAKNELIRLKQMREAEEANLKDAQLLETKVLNKVRSEKEQNRILENELKTAMGKLEKLIAEMEMKRKERKLPPGTHFFEIMKGKLPWPYYGAVVSGFGSVEDPKYKTKIRNTGIDIKCPVGADVRAIADGRVVYAERFMGYGNLVILDHGDGYYTLYSNLAEMTCSVGMNLKQGEVLGKSKDILHFELRREGKAVDPLPWLSQ